jgi:mannuronan 5-epimerase
MDSFLFIAIASSPDGYISRDTNYIGNKVIQAISSISNREYLEFGANVNNSGSIQQYENDTSVGPGPIIPKGIAPNSSSQEVSSSLTSPAQVSENKACVMYDPAIRTINLCGGSTDLSTINQIVNSSDILSNTSDKSWILNANISVENGATLFINSTDVSWLRINSTAGRAYAIVAYGNLIIDRTKISSLNSTSNTETALTIDSNTNKSTPRAYLLMHWAGTGQMNITNSIISNLGFNGAKDTWGIAYYSGPGSTLQNNSISSNFRGVYLTTNASNILVANNTIQNSSQHGLNLYKASSTSILDNKVSSSKEHGLLCTIECKNILIKSNYIYDNARNGIVLDQGTSNSTVKQNVVNENNRSGIAIRNSSENIVSGNLIQQNRVGITIAQNSSFNVVNNNTITGSISNGLLLDTNSTRNKIEKNLVTGSSGAGAYVRGSSDNTLSRNYVTDHQKNGLVLFNATRNDLVSNNISDNIPYNYYIRSNSKLNVIKDTHLDNANLRFFDNSTNILVENTDNRITNNNNKRYPVKAYPTNATLLIEPVTKNVLINNLDMFVIPSKDYVDILSTSKDFETNQKYKRWLEKSPVLLSSDGNKPSTRYIVGNFAPDTQIMINVNNSFWNAYTSNSSGYIDFVYDGYARGPNSGIQTRADLQSFRILEFEAEASNRPTVAAVIFFSALITGSVAFIIVGRYLKRRKTKTINNRH